MTAYRIHNQISALRLPDSLLVLAIQTFKAEFLIRLLAKLFLFVHHYILGILCINIKSKQLFYLLINLYSFYEASQTSMFEVISENRHNALFYDYFLQTFLNKWLPSLALTEGHFLTKVPMLFPIRYACPFNII